jgi:hypothetical protein
MPVREKLSIRLDPEMVSLGRRLAKKDFGSEQKFGLLIENAIRSYHARQVQPIEASSLLSATEEALIARIEKRVEEMGTKTINRVGNLIAKSSFETALNSIILEKLYEKQGSKDKAKIELEQFRKIAVGRMKTRLDKESADQITSLIEENQNLVTRYNSLLDKYKDVVEQNGHFENAVERLSDRERELVGKFNRQLEISNNEQATKESVKKWTKGLIEYLEQNSEGLIKKSASKLVEEYTNQHPKPKGV